MGKSAYSIAVQGMGELISKANLSEAAVKEALKPINEQMEATSKLALNSNGNITKTLNKMNSGASTKIICVGDSTTWGFRPVDPGRGAQVASPYPEVLQTRLMTAYNNSNITVVNNGVNSWRTVEALQNMPSVIAQAPDLVLLMLGINDVRGSSFGGVVPLSDYKINIATMVEELVRKGIEVILMTPIPINDTTNNNHKTIQMYSKAVEEVSTMYGVGFVDIQKEITKMYFSEKVYPVDFLGDSVHPNDDNYKFIADIVINKLLQYNETTEVLYLNTREKYSIPIYYSPFVNHNLTDNFTNAAQIYKSNYTMPTGSTGLFLKINFYVSVPNMSLVLRHVRNTVGGKITVYDNGMNVGTVDFYAPASHVFNTESVLIKNLTLGWHSIVFDQSNLTLGQSATNGNAYFSEFIFRPNETLRNDLVYVNVAGATMPTLENFKAITNGKARLKNTVTNEQKGAILYSGGSAQLESGKKMVIEAEGIFFATSGFSWFGNDLQSIAGTVVSGVLSGYVLYLTTVAVSVYCMGANNALGTAVASTPITGFDFGKSHVIRIEHGYDGAMVVYIDGVQYLSLSDTRNKNGFFGLWTYGAGTVELSRFEHCLIPQ